MTEFSNCFHIFEFLSFRIFKDCPGVWLCGLRAEVAEKGSGFLVKVLIKFSGFWGGGAKYHSLSCYESRSLKEENLFRHDVLPLYGQFSF